MSVETELENIRLDVEDLGTGIADLTESVNVKKAAMDQVVLDSATAATAAANSVLASRVRTVDLAAAATVGLMAYTGAEAQSIFDNAMPMQDYTALRAYTGRSAGARITTIGLAGVFQRDATDTTSADNGGTIIVDASGRRWKRLFDGSASVVWFGAGAAGSTDDTAAIQAAFNAEKHIFIPKRDYIIDGMDAGYPTTSFGGGVKPQNESFIQFGAGARFILKSNAATATGYVIFNLRDTTNVTIYDGNVLGDVDTHSGTTGEWGMGYYVASATNPRLMNCKASKCWGDGFFVGSSVETTGTPSISGVLSNCVADDNRRQGLSIVSWSKGLVLGGEYKNTGLTKFTQPAYGIDIEPDTSGLDLIDVMLVGIRTSGNKYGGLQLVPGFMSANTYTHPRFNVSVVGYDSLQDGTFGALRFAYPGLTATGMNVANAVYGSIKISDVQIVESVGRGVDFARWIQNAPDVTIDGISVIDCNTSGNTATNEDQSGIVLFMDVANVAQQTGHGKVTIINPRIVDTRTVPKMLLPIQMACGAGQSFSGIDIRNPSGSGWSSATNGLVRVVNASGVSVTFDNPLQKDFSATGSFTNGAFAGYSIASTVSTVQTLPPANTSIGLTYIFENRYGVTLQVRPDAADTILQLGRTAGNDAVMRFRGDRLRLRSLGSNGWEVLEAIGNITPLGFAQPRTILWNTAAPTTGTWIAGDRVLNSTPAVGSPKSWVCTVGGTPGTWVSEGNL